MMQWQCSTDGETNENSKEKINKENTDFDSSYSQCFNHIDEWKCDFEIALFLLRTPPPPNINDCTVDFR